MQLRQLASVQHWLPNHPMASDPIWSRDSSAVTEMEIQLFYARAGLQGFRNEAIDAIDSLQAALILSSINGESLELPSAIVLHEPPAEPFLVDELVDGLAKLRPARRQACLFALELHRLPKDVANMTWKDVRKMTQVSPLGREILAAANQTRHLTLPYVFWEWSTPTIATPLLELQWNIEHAFECTWPALMQRYKRMVAVSRSADATSLLELARR